MIEKMTPDQLKAVFDLSDTSDVTDAERQVAKKTFGSIPRTHIISFIRLLKHYHPELFVDPRLEAAKKLAREILAEEYDEKGILTVARHFRGGFNDDTFTMKAVTRALLMDPPTGDAQ